MGHVCEVVTLLLVCLSGFANSIASNRINIIEDRPSKAIGATTRGGICDDGFTITPSQKEFTVSFDLGDIYILHEINLIFANAKDASVIDEYTASIGFSDSNYFTKYKEHSREGNKIVLRPICFDQKQWGASGSTLRLHFRGKRTVTIQCIEALGVLNDGRNVMIGKPIMATNPTCENNLFLLNDVFEDGALNYNVDPFNIMIDLGKIFKPKELEVSMYGPWDQDNMSITFMENYYQGRQVTNCISAGMIGRYKCDVSGLQVRYVAIEGEEYLPKIREIKVNL